MRRAAKVDENQPEIVKALRRAGCSVQSLAAIGAGCPDLLVWSPWLTCGQLQLIEIKNKGGKGDKLTPAQEKFHSAWDGFIHRVTSVDEALRAMGIRANETGEGK